MCVRAGNAGTRRRGAVRRAFVGLSASSIVVTKGLVTGGVDHPSFFFSFVGYVTLKVFFQKGKKESK